MGRGRLPGAVVVVDAAAEGIRNGQITHVVNSPRLSMGRTNEYTHTQTDQPAINVISLLHAHRQYLILLWRVCHWVFLAVTACVRDRCRLSTRNYQALSHSDDQSQGPDAMITSR